jgi:LysM repeat protein
MMPKRLQAALLAACMMSATTWSNAMEIPKGTTVTKVVVKQYDTLWGIAESHFKDPWKWRQIWKLNMGSIKNPDLIYPDQIILLPKPFTAGTAQASAKPIPVIHAHVISVLEGTSVSGPQTILVIDKGKQDGVEIGLLMTLYHKDNVTGTTKQATTSGPGYGQLVVFRTYDKQSYASTLPANLVVGLMDGARTSVDQATVSGEANVAANKVSPSVMAPRRHRAAKHHFKRRGRDARSCLRLKSNREIAACAERYR